MKFKEIKICLWMAAALMAIGSYAQNVSLNGMVTTSTGQPAPNVLLTLSGVGLADATGQDGSYILSNTDDPVNLTMHKKLPAITEGYRKMVVLSGRGLHAVGRQGHLIDIYGRKVAEEAVKHGSGVYFIREEIEKPVTAPLAKSAQIDQIILTYGGEVVHTVDVNSYDGELNIQLPGPLPANTIGSHTLDFDKILYIKRETFRGGETHYYDYFQMQTGISMTGGIYIYDLGTGQETEINTGLGAGIYNTLDISFDGKKIVFDFMPSGQSFRLYEINLDGTGLVQLTSPSSAHHDITPCYLPDGGIAFSSSRPEFSVPCNVEGVLNVPILHKIDGDGSNLRRLSEGAISEFDPAVMNDGRIIYARWEYVDKPSLTIKCIWAMNPDGSNSQEVYGNDICFPPSFITPQVIPGNDNLVMMIGTSHYMGGPMGMVIQLDTRQNIRTTEPMNYVTQISITGEMFDNPSDPMFKDLWPIREDLYMVSHKPGGSDWSSPTGYKLVLLDKLGNTTDITNDNTHSLWNAVPLLARKRPPIPVGSYDESLIPQNLAQVIVSDVYVGMEGIERGRAKWIRINEQMPRPWNTAHQGMIGDAASFWVRAHYGIVPIESDGSANFYVPAKKNIFFQVLDENYAELQRERTFINYQPGEVAACIGCHETKGTAPPTTMPAALQRAPSTAQQQPGGSAPGWTIDFDQDIQPILNQHCVSCHSGMNYESLRASPTWIGRVINEDEICDGGEYLPPLSMGGHSGLLLPSLINGTDGHSTWQEYNIPEADMVKLITWLDANAQRKGSYDY
jgi:hypothetical protein